MTAPALEARGLTRQFGSFTAVRNVSFRVDPGETCGLLGLNGAGKTTILRMLTTLLKPTSGTALVMGHDIRERPAEARAHLGVVSEDSGRVRLDWRLPHYLEYFGRLHGLSRHETMERARPLIERLIPGDFHNGELDTFSGGMRKKVELIRALLPRPPVLLLDEPTKELDIPSKEDLWGFLQDLSRKEGVSILLTSHDAIEIETLCQRVCILRDGSIAQEGRIETFPTGAAFQRHVARLLADAQTRASP